MFKSKLQEVCQQRKWGLPEYVCIKDGPDHLPLFRASVFLNGMEFQTPTPSLSSKDAYNHAAHLAFLHFSTPSSSSSSSSLSGSSTPNAELVEGLNTVDTSQSRYSSTSNLKDGTINLYKRKLQNLAQSKNLDSPSYSVRKEGPPCALSFKATVTVDGHSFESPGLYNTSNEAENAAAKVALMSLTLHGFQESERGLYKNLLQELAQNEGFALPVYKTMRCGTPHKPVFFSTVEVEGETFQGKGGPSKKQAEINAANVAYTHFMARLSNRNGRGEEEEEEEETSEFSPNAEPNTQEETIKHGGGPSIIKLDEVVEESSRNSARSTEDQSLPSKLSTLSITAHSKARRNTEDDSYLLCNRVKIYRCIPETAFPRGTVLLPISEGKWAAVSLEFPNEKAM